MLLLVIVVLTRDGIAFVSIVTTTFSILIIIIHVITTIHGDFSLSLSKFNFFNTFNHFWRLFFVFSFAFIIFLCAQIVNGDSQENIEKDVVTSDKKYDEIHG